MPGLEPRRGSLRLPIRMTVVISGTDYEHQPFNETAETLDVGKFGARILTGRKLRLGSMVSLRRANSEKAEAFRVVYLGEPDPETRKNPVGLEMASIENFWGHAFPPDRW